MADLDFRHNVSQIPAGADLPQPYQRHVGSEASGVPDVQGAAANYAEKTNWMSTLGSTVATKSSTALATKLGGEAGKNPQGDIGIPITNFDKSFQESYRTQAQATLGLQADKLITDANLAMAKAPRLSPDIIAKTNSQVSLGLQNIFKNAPAEIRPHLEYQFGSVQLSQAEQATKRMISESREDQKEALIAANTKANQNAYQVARSGNDKAAQAMVDSVKKNTAAAVAMHNMTPAAAALAVDTAQKSADAGLYGAKAEEARKNGTYEQFSKDLSEKPPEGMSYDRWESVMTNVSNENAQIHNMRMQSEQIALSQFKLDIMENPNSPDIAAKLQALKENVSHNSFLEAQIGLLTLQAKNNKDGISANELANNWTNINSQNQGTDKTRNVAFRKLVQGTMDYVTRSGKTMSEAEAEVNVAAQSPVPVKEFVDKLNTKMHSGNPQLMEEASYAIEHLHEVQRGDALKGIDEQTMSLMDKFNALKMRGDLSGHEAAAEAKRIVYGPHTSEEADALKTAWSDHIKKRKEIGRASCRERVCQYV